MAERVALGRDERFMKRHASTAATAESRKKGPAMPAIVHTMGACQSVLYINSRGNTLSTDPNIIVVDSTVTDAMLHGNYVNGAIEWAPANSNHDLPPSLCLSGKPAFFGSRPWPISGADLAPSGGKLPAQDRFEGN